MKASLLNVYNLLGLVILLFLLPSQSFRCPIQTLNRLQRSPRLPQQINVQQGSLTTDHLPTAEKARLFLKVIGQHSVNPLFRAELKKELTFFRGCGAYFSETGPDSAIIIAEGKTAQLEKFIHWLQLFSVALSERKPSFQSPNLVVHIKEKQWEDYTGKLKGFQTKHDAPELEDTLALQKEGVMEAKNMLGTDESV